MSVRNLDLLFTPKSIAVVGASGKPHSVGNTLLLNLVSCGYAGPVLPVNPHRDEIAGVRAYRSVGDLPQVPDLAMVAVPASSVASVIDELGQLGTRAAVIISAGFREVGPAGKSLEDEIETVARRYPGFRIMGPNCLGFLVPRLQLSASFAVGMPHPGRVAFVSQSGALCTAILDWALREEIGFSYFISLGNLLDVDFADVIDFLADDEETQSLVLYIESVVRAREFVSAARAFTRRKPMVVYKAGRFQQSAQAASSHTGALAGLDSAYDAAFRRAAIVRVYDSEQIFDCAEFLARTRVPAGPRLAIVSNAGGPGVMATDTLIERGGELAPLSDNTLQALNEFLPTAWSHRNPVDVLGDATPERFARACQVAIADEHVDALLAILTPQAMTQPLETARQVADALNSAHKPVLSAWMGGAAVAEARDVLNRYQIPTLNTPEQAVRSFLYLASYARDLELLYEAPRAIPLRFELAHVQRSARVSEIVDDYQGLLTESLSKQLLDVYQIPNTRASRAATIDEAEHLAEQLGYPLVMKLLSPDVSHKTDVGGVKVDLQHAADVRRAYKEIIAAVRESCPQARIDGVTLQRYFKPLYGVELILGCRRDPVFGPLLMIGLGGIATEILRDCAFELPPLDELLARRQLERLRCYPILQGFRGRPAMAIDALIEVMLRFSSLLIENPAITDCDLNPLVVTPEQVLALDARIAFDRQVHVPAGRPYAHLAIAPYPEELRRTVRLKDGSEMTLRPIRPEDEPAWHAMVDSASEQTIWQRFRSPLRSSIHHHAARYCFIDYDREMALVAETLVEGQPKLVGVARLVADRNYESAEFAILVTDAWQRRGLGSQLLDACLQVARSIRLQTVRAETAWDNTGMLALFRSRGFEIRRFPDDPTTVLAVLDLGAA